MFLITRQQKKQNVICILLSDMYTPFLFFKEVRCKV